MKFEEIEKEILKTLKNSPLVEEVDHAKNVLKWVLKMKPDAGEELRIAALSHDIDRAINKITESQMKDNNYAQFKKEHAERSAKIVSEMLRENGYPKDFIKRVEDLIERHEVGGTEEADVLKDADSLAYFEYNIPFYLKRNGEYKTKEKIKFMHNRMSGEAKKIIKLMRFEDPKVLKLMETIK